jgi:hypothetical protein
MGPEIRKGRALGWLGGPALFGFVSCQAPDSPEDPAVRPKDTVEAVRQPPISVMEEVPSVVTKADTVPAARTADTVPIGNPKGPAHAGQACDSLEYPDYYCGPEREILACEGGAMAGASPPKTYADMGYYELKCFSGLSEPIPVHATMGFNGSDAADRSLPRPRTFLRGEAVRRKAIQGDGLIGPA